MTDLIALAKQAGATILTDMRVMVEFKGTQTILSLDQLQSFADLIAAREREACAVLCAIEPLDSCNQIERSLWIVATELCSDAIRARTTT